MPYGINIEWDWIKSGFTALGGGFAFLVKQYIIPVVKKRNEERKSLAEKINKIHYEMTSNGGGSIKDAINRIEWRLGDIESTQKVAMNVQGVAFWISDEEGLCTYASPHLCKIMGRSEDEIKGNGWASWLIAEDRERVFDAWRFSVENRSAFDEYYTYRKSDGTLQKVHGLAFHKNVAGKHAGTFGRLEKIENVP